MSDDSKQGGPEWERNQAAAKMGAALVQHDQAALVEAASDLGDAVVNGAAAKLIPTLRTVLESVLNRELGSIRAHMENSDRARLDRNTDFQTQIDARFDTSDANQGAMLSEMRGFSETLGKTVRQVEHLGARVGTVESTVNEITSGLEQVESKVDHTNTKVDRVGGRVDVLEEKVESVIGTQHEHTKTLAQHGELLEKINRQYTDLSVLMVHMDFLSEDRPQPSEVAGILRRLRDATPE